MKTGEFEAKGRGIQGNIIQRLTEKTGDLCSIATVTENQDLLMITNEGTIIRTPAKGIPTYGRNAAGVILMRLSDGAKLVNFALADSEEDKPEEQGEADETDETDEADEAGETGDSGTDAHSAEVTGEGDEFVTEMDLGEDPGIDEETFESDENGDEDE
jgi:DNA gyrase subunit A